MRTRSRAGAAPKDVGSEQDAPQEEVEDAGEATSDSDDEAPEEQEFESSKKSATEQRLEEKKAQQAASAQKKQQRRGRSAAAAEASQGAVQQATGLDGEPGQTAEARPAGSNAADAGETLEQEEELDLLSDDVLDAVAQSSALNPQGAKQRSIISQHLRTGLAPQSSAQKRRKVVADATTERLVGPVTVRVLGAVQPAHASESARAFLQQRRYGARVERSLAMLQPVKVEGVFQHTPHA